jgi:phosphatidylglycerophosphatase A
MKSFKDSLFVFIGSAFGLGLMPIAPGSFGALLGVAMHLGIAIFLFPEPDQSVCRLLALVACLVTTSVIHFLLNSWAERYWNDSDSGHFVLDEVVGYLVVPIILYASTAPLWYLVTAGFLIFRIFDIIKLPVARYIDRHWHNAWGVLLDDVVSGIYASGVVWLIAYFVWR